MKLSVLLERPISAKEARRTAKRLGDTALVGFEFEFAVPEHSSLHDITVGDHVQEVRRITGFDELFSYFSHDSYTRRRIELGFEDWKEQKREDWVEENWGDYLPDAYYDSTDADEMYDMERAAKDEANDAAHNKVDQSEQDYVEDAYGGWGALISDFNLMPDYGWVNPPARRGGHEYDRAEFYTQEPEDDGGNTRANVAEQLAHWLKTTVSTNDSAPYSMWKVVPDGSIDGGVDAEIVSPPMPWNESKHLVARIAAFANRFGLITNTSTGLHINVSVPHLNQKIDLVKFVLFLGDDYALKMFSRTGSTYAASQTKKMIDALSVMARQMRDNQSVHVDLQALHNFLRNGLGTTKYNSVNISKLINEGFLEIRIAGGDYLNRFEQTSAFLDRILIALDIATDPHAERNLYIKKMIKLLERTRMMVEPTRKWDDTAKIPLGALIMHDPAAYTLWTRCVRHFAQDTKDKEQVFADVQLMTREIARVVQSKILNNEISHLSSSQALEFAKLLKRLGLSIETLRNQGNRDTREALRILGLAK